MALRLRLSSMTKTLVALLAGCLILTACAGDTVEPAGTTTSAEPGTTGNTWTENADALEKNRALWESRLFETYEMTYVSRCGENGFITDGEVTIAVTGEAVTLIAGTLPFEVTTVDRLFDVIAEGETAEIVEITYGEFGQPTDVNIDWMADATDDEFCVVVSSFEPAS